MVCKALRALQHKLRVVCPPQLTTLRGHKSAVQRLLGFESAQGPWRLVSASDDGKVMKALRSIDLPCRL
jgi:hypothetical protein